jgi:glyoxylase-like metal-dependent hydrolase (beta-lactamase superfamily II)
LRDFAPEKTSEMRLGGGRMSVKEVSVSGNYEIIEIGAGSWRIEVDVVRVFLFEGTERALLVDTGFGGGDLRSVVEGLTKKPVLLANTHSDDDHIGGNGQFEIAHLHPSEYAGYLGKFPEARVSPLWDGDVLDLGGRRFEVVLIPGHTPGSIALLDRENRILVSGDSVSMAPIFIFGETRSLRAFCDSTDKIIALRDSYDVIFPSHGPFPVDPSFVMNIKECADSLLRGELTGQDPPIEIPARMYARNGASFFAD